MPKEIFIDPEEVRKSGKLSFDDIPLNQYDKTISDEKDNYSKEELLRMYRDMAYIREFETMMKNMKDASEYNGVKHNYLGPAHLYFGEESVAVGQAHVLGIEDYIFGSHRSHGEILAKGLSAIEKLSDDELMEIMENFFDGKVLNKIKGKQKNNDDVKELAIDFLLYGATSEIFFKDTGFNRGLGGSMHAFFIPFGIYPNNAIVGGSAPISTGAALYKKLRKESGIVVANIGDGSLGCGPVWEAINFSAMGQLKELWEEDYKGGLPIIFNFMDNQYGMGGQTSGETMAYDILARFGAGVNPEQMHAERIDGYNPLAVIDGFKRKKELIEAGEGPVLLDTLTYRLGGHSTSDANAYRTKEELQVWEEQDCMKNFKDELIKAGIAEKDEFEKIDKEIIERITKVCEMAADNDTSPYMEAEEIGDLMYSNNKKEKMADGECEVLTTKEENSRYKRLKNKERVGIKDGKEVSSVKRLQLRDALFEPIFDKFYEDPTLIAYGEDHRHWGGAFAVYNGLTESLPYHRFFNSPISEAAICGSAVGYALCGGRVIVELMYADFLGRAGDEVFNQMAKWQAMSAGILEMPLILRVPIGNKYGAQHSQDWTALTSHIPGLKVVYPVTPYDAKGLMNTALNGTDPVIFFEKQNLYGVGEQFHLEEGVPEENYEITLGEPDVKREGEDVTILSVGSTIYRTVEAAEKLESEHGLSAEIIDARSIVPFNYEKVIESVKKTGRIVVTGDACERGSILSDFAQNISELAFDYLDAPPAVVGSRNWITPATDLEDYFFPQPEWIIDAIHEKILPLENYVPENNYTNNEKIRRYKEGI